MKGKHSLLEEKHLGIINAKLTTSVPYRDVLSFSGLYAPPFVSSNFVFEGRIFGEKVPTSDYTWQPREVHRQGVLNNVTVESDLVLTANQRGLILSFTLENQGASAVRVPVWYYCPQNEPTRNSYHH
jgi:hypothetical protein